MDNARRNLVKNGSVDTAALALATQKKVEIYRKTREVFAVIGIRTDVELEKPPKSYRGRKRIRRPVKYAHLVERGFTHNKSGERIDGKPFLEPAIDKAMRESQLEKQIREAFKKKLLELI